MVSALHVLLLMARHYSLVMVEVEIVYDSLEIKIFFTGNGV